MMPATTITPITVTIPAFTVTPQINTPTFPEDIDQYNSELPAVIVAQTTLKTQLNTFITQVGTLENNVIALEASTLSASAVALMAANFQGIWTNQLTVVGQSWAYGGVLYGVLVAGTASPATTPSNWIALNKASAIINTPAGGISATTVQGALDELDSEKFSISDIPSLNILPKSGGTMTGAITALRETKVAMGANDIDLSAGNLFTKTISGATTLTVSNWLATSNANSFILELTNGGSAAITWFSGVKWAGGTAPTLTASGVDILGFYSHDGGTTVRGIVLAKDSK